MVTNASGLLYHVTIVGREHGIPSVVVTPRQRMSLSALCVTVNGTSREVTFEAG
ncbi:PEP-utilizing enzyme [Silicimonas sp. MF1-12-2]|uniref:PEP-utilizing enzyme n=1 Tax=Silicimonas sp. MF1-12-2 TaxID=3384793 RepID=UPI0039B63483